MFYDVVFHDMHSKGEIYWVVLKVIKMLEPFIKRQHTFKQVLLKLQSSWTSPTPLTHGTITGSLGLNSITFLNHFF